ncbi:MAG: CGNR zinc finger domain-containing protein [Actinoplanes sp.]
MSFTHDTEMSLVAAAALVNTISDDDGELLPDPAALEAFRVKFQWSGRIDGTEEELEQVRALRPRLRRIWTADEVEVVEIVNELLREFQALPQLVRHDKWPYHLHATPMDSPFAVRIAVDAAMGFVDVVRDEQLDRLRICEFPTCDNVVVDLTRNRSKRFCEAGCGNRAAVNAYRARKAAATRS